MSESFPPEIPESAPAVASGITFESLQLIEPILRAIREKGYTTPSPIQTQAIPPVLEGRDMLGLAQTGTGKTASFTLPILQRLSQIPCPKRSKCPRALVLVPTRELAAQVEESVRSYGKYTGISSAVAFGGVAMGNQMKALAKGVDIMVATPGRLLDLCKRNAIRLEHVEIFVLDEADRMLDMGFGRDVKRIEEFIPAERQTLLFSATLPPEIREMAEGMMRNPARVAITPEKPAVERIEQSVCFVERQHKLPLFLHFWKKETDSGKNGLTLVFARTKVGANRLSGLLRDEGVKVEAIHGNKSQSQREHALKNFRDKKSPILIATDIAARGIDVKGITLVINYDLPDDPESYVHRIGRTARAGAEGRAIAFCSHDELLALRDVEKFMKRAIPVFKFEHPFQSDSIASKYRPWTVNPPRGGEQSNLPDIRKNKFMRQGSDRANSGGGGGRRPDRSGSGSRKFEKKPFRAGGQGGAPRPDSTAGFGNTGPKKEPFFKKLWNSVTPGNDAGRPPSRDEIPRSERSYGSKPAGGPKPYGQKPSFGKKPYGGGGFKKKY